MKTFRLKNFLKLLSKRYFLILVLISGFPLFFLSGCEEFFVSEVENLDVPGGESKLVVNSYISPQDSVIRVFVHRSVSYLENQANDPVIGDQADVYMARKGEDMVRLEYDQNRMVFVIDADIIGVEAGNHYVLRVEPFEGEAVDAECYVPHLSFSDLDISSPLIVPGEWGTEETQLEWHFKATGGNETNYYSTGAYTKFYEVREYYQDTVHLFTSLMSMDKGQSYFTDDDGSNYSFRARNSDYYYGWKQGQTQGAESGIIDSIFVFIIQSDINYYNFHKGVEDYFYYDADMPFSEAVHIYTNINGGLGVFAGYNRMDFSVPEDTR